ncbi:FAD/NAD(P)-binding domain-containing protein [Xylariaceae sp. FL0804]|nr:FAD/NAD(P)-binding domain-containing protein [Xylariaceae sp. FL0804]
MVEQRRIKVAIAGGGIAGLALAFGLSRRPHVDVRVYESVPAYADVGAGLALHLNAIKAMSLIGPELRQAYQDKALTMGADEETEMATEVILAQGPHAGTRVAELGRAKGRRTVSRADLLDGFSSLLPPGCISFGKRLEAIVEPGEEEAEGGEEEKNGTGNNDNGSGGDGMLELRFRDGTRASADCLLGADGVHSLTRAHLLGRDHPATGPKNHDGWRIYRTLVATAEAERHIDAKWTRCVPILLGPRGHVNCIPLNKNTRLSAGVAVRGGAASSTTTNNTTTENGDGGGGAGPSLDPALYADYSPEARRIVALVARDTSASWAPADHDHAPTYARGRVAVFGDAAHASLPFAGNGAAQALEDAAVLDALLGRVVVVDSESTTAHKAPAQSQAQVAQRLGAALQAYDRVRRPRSQAVVDLARKFGRVYAYAEDGMHEDPVRMKKFFGEMAAMTNNFDVKGQNDEALRVFDSLLDGSGA